MPDEINNLDPEDIGLKGIFGDRFHDETARAPEKPENIQTNVNITIPAKAVQTKAGSPTAERKTIQSAQWEPMKPEPDFMDKLKTCAKYTCLFGGLCTLVFYWQQTGQMADSAAVPSMLACFGLAGLGIGKATAK